MVTEEHPPVGGHIVSAVFEDFCGGGVVIARLDDFRLDEPRIEPVADDVGADRRDDEPDRVDGLAAGEGDDRPGHRTEQGDHPENDLVPGVGSVSGR